MSFFSRFTTKVRQRVIPFIIATLGLALSPSILADIITFNGVSNNSQNSNAIPWVFGSTMWEHLDSATGTGVSVSPPTGFSSLEGKDITKLTFSFGDLALTSFLSPGPASAGFEVYTDDGSGTPFQFLFDGVLWAAGTVNYLRTDVTSNIDAAATALLSVTLDTAGMDSAFFDELISRTNGSGDIELLAQSFTPVSTGQFTSITTLELPAAASVPGPATGLLFLAGLLGVGASIRRSKKNRNS